MNVLSFSEKVWIRQSYVIKSAPWTSFVMCLSFYSVGINSLMGATFFKIKSIFKSVILTNLKISVNKVINMEIFIVVPKWI